MRLLNTNCWRVMAFYNWAYRSSPWFHEMACETNWPHLFFQTLETECRCGKVPVLDSYSLSCGSKPYYQSFTLYWDNPDRVLEISRTGQVQMFRPSGCHFAQLYFSIAAEDLRERFRELIIQTTAK